MRREIQKSKKRFVFSALICAAAFSITAPWGLKADAAEAGEWRQEDDVKYWYEYGVKQGLEGRGKEIYDPESDAWYWLDSVQDGAMAVSKDVYQESEAGDWGDFVNDEGKRCGKWVRYDENGHMIKGWDTNDNGTYYFDPVYGTMAKGTATIDGKEYTFDPGTGILIGMPAPVLNGWAAENGVAYWYENGVKQGLEGRGKEIYDPGSDAWYWLDSVQDGAMAVSKDVYQESEAGDWGDFVNDEGKRCGKWVRYDENGHMVKGWSTGENGTYYFDPVYGTMAKGRAQIDGIYYVFNQTTGVLEKDESRCNLPLSSSYYKYEYAYRTQDLSGLSQEDMPFYEALKAYLDYALQYDTPFLQEKAIHNYMLLNCEYDYENFCNGTIPWVSYSAAGVLVHKTAVCSGYASAFQLFMDILGIECETITSNQLNHAWNRVKLDGDWYMVDVTWDDPVPDVPGRIRYTYFNMPSQYFGHEASDYSQTAEGTKWMGDAVYYATTEEAAEKITEILKTEIKLLSPDRLFYICVTPTANMSVQECMNSLNIYSLEYANAYYWSESCVAEGTSMLIRSTVCYNSYEEYEKEVIGDVTYTCSVEEAKDTISHTLKEEAPNMTGSRSVAFYITGEQQEEQYYYDMLDELRTEHLLFSAYYYQVQAYQDRVLIRMVEAYESYDAFLHEYFAKDTFEATPDTAVEAMGQRIIQQGTGFSGSDSCAVIISREGDNSWENGDISTAVSNLVNQMRYYHPYCDFYQVCSWIYGDSIVICFRPYDSYEQYLQSKNIAHFELVTDENATETIRSYMQEIALTEETSKWSYFYIEKTRDWTNREMDSLGAKLRHGKYGCLYISGSFAFGDNWIRLYLFPKYSDPAQRTELINSSYDVSESDSFALIQSVLNGADVSSHKTYQFYVAKNNGTDWYQTEYYSYLHRLESFLGSAPPVTDYDYVADILYIQLTP